jgi:hypothetical protein
MKSKKTIKLNPEHKGDFTKFAKTHGKSVKAMASLVLKNKEHYSPHVVKMAVFAHNFTGKKKAQVGYNNGPTFNPIQQDPNYNWLQANNAIPGIPGEVDPLSQMITSNQGTPVKQAKIIPPNQDYTVKSSTNLTIDNDNEGLKQFNTFATGLTGIANTIANNKLKNQERGNVLNSLTPAYQDNMEGQGLNNIPMYTQYGGSGGRGYQDWMYEGIAHQAFYGETSLPSGGSGRQYGGSGKYIVKRPYGGGPLTSEGAKEILRDDMVHGRPLTEKQKRFFGWVAGGKKQTGGATSPEGNVRRLSPAEMQQWNQFLDYVKQKGYEGSPELNKKNKNLGSTLFNEFKASNPGISIDYSIVPSVQNEMQVLGQSARDFATRHNMAGADKLMTGVSPVDNWFGSKTSQYRFPGATLVTTNNGVQTSEKNLGLVQGNTDKTLQATGSGTATVKKKTPPPGVKVEDVIDANGRKSRVYEDPQTGDLVEVDFQAGGSNVQNESDYIGGGPVEAEAGEIIQDGAGGISKISDDANTHEQGGVKLGNVNRVLEDTSDKRKDKASKLLRMSPEEVFGLFGFKPKSPVSHSKAFELATKHYGDQRKKITGKNEIINEYPEMDKYASNAAKMNLKTIKNLPSENDVYDALFMHQEAIKGIHGIQDDGSLAKNGGRYSIKRQAGGSTESNGSIRPPRGRKSGEFYFDEGTQRWFKKGTVPSASAKQQFQQPQQPDNNSGIIPYKGGSTSSGKTTPTGNSNAFNFPGGLDTFKQAWQPVLDLGKYNDVASAQKATYDYLIKNQPDVASSIWENQGLTQKGRDLMNPKSKNYDPGFARVAQQAFDETGKLRPDVKLTPDQLQALTPAYVDNMLGVRAVTPSQLSQTTGTDQPQPGKPSIGKTPLDASVTVNPKFITQPNNQFHESTYWDELAPGLTSLTDSMRRDPELYNPVQFNQLRYKLLDPTAALNANQADYNAALESMGNNNLGSGAAAANQANLQAQKYAANAQIEGTYDNQNAQIKNREIDYNTGVRDRQSVADAQSRGEYYRNVQLSREAQRQQRLKAIEDISRVIQMKRRQNTSGNLILKLSPAFNQQGDYNGYQYMPVLPSDIGVPGETPVIGGPQKRSSTKTTTSWKLGDKTVKRTTTE